jgi:membrane-bound serine protease (ClpP class)
MIHPSESSYNKNAMYSYPSNFKQIFGNSLLLRLLATLQVCILLIATNTNVHAAGNPPMAFLLNADGAITPAMAEYVSRGIQTAERQGAELIILQLNTPGGSVDVMTRMITDMRNSDVPIVVYVAPRGAMAGSAGTVITLAGHIAAMAPETAIGAASPVGDQGQNLDTTLEAKIKNILEATVRSLAERRGTEAITLAEQTIESAKAVSANEALKAGLIDFIASDVQDLLKQLDGFQVETKLGAVTLNTTGMVVTPIPVSFIEQLLATLTNPNIVFLLITIGVQAILIEISSPGGWIAGFIGVVCLALAAYGLNVLPVNWFGLIFIATSFVLFVLDIKAPTHGALTAAGVATLIIGALVLFNSPQVPSFQHVSVPLIIGTSMITGGLFFTVLIFALRAQRAPIRTGQESLVGRQGIVRSELAPTGTVQVGGELWSAELAEGEEKIPINVRIQVVRVHGVRLYVRKVT